MNIDIIYIIVCIAALIVSVLIITSTFWVAKKMEKIDDYKRRQGFKIKYK